MKSGSVMRAAVAVLCLVMLVATAPVLRGGGLDGDLAFTADEKIAGKSYPEWTAAWAQWISSVKKERHPLIDKTGDFGGEGQAGPVWFLSGNIGGTNKRKITVPAGTPIFSPVLFSVISTSADDTQGLVAKVRETINRADEMEVTLDGKSLGDLSKQRVTPELFQINGLGQDAVHPIFSGKRTMALDGYWFMLKPLTPGEHTMRVRGKLKAENVEDRLQVDITYQFIAASK